MTNGGLMQMCAGLTVNAEQMNSNDWHNRDVKAMQVMLDRKMAFTNKMRKPSYRFFLYRKENG